jgi:PKHD-type hydroxylase
MQGCPAPSRDTISMLVIPDFLSRDEVVEVNRLMDSAPFDDGRATAAGQAARVKDNRQVSRSWPGITALDGVVERAIRRSRPLLESVSPCAHSQPLYVGYASGSAYGAHVDAVMSGMPPIRQDVSMTVFLSPPEDYVGGELLLHESGGERRAIRHAAGTAFVYPTGIVHEVVPVERGERRAVVLWFQSYYRDPEIREAVAELRRCVEAARRSGADPLPLVKVLNTLERRFIST